MTEFSTKSKTLDIIGSTNTRSKDFIQAVRVINRPVKSMRSHANVDEIPSLNSLDAERSQVMETAT